MVMTIPIRNDKTIATTQIVCIPITITIGPNKPFIT